MTVERCRSAGGRRWPIVLIVLAGIVMMLHGGASAQRIGPARLPTTMVLEAPYPGKKYGDNARILTISIDRASYRFVLRDIYVADSQGAMIGDDVWRAVQQHRPSMVVRGGDGQAVARTRPGEMVSVQGLFSFASRTFEISSVSPGMWPWAPPRHY